MSAFEIVAPRATAEAPKAPCWLCDDTGQVEVERDSQGRPTLQTCMACVNEP